MFGYFVNLEVKNILLMKPQKTKRQPMQSSETINIRPNPNTIKHVEHQIDSENAMTRIY
jgi:hypothetical protein